MSEVLTLDALSILLVSAAVGVVVGLTGMGGGALMTPALIFLGVNPTAAVANDLVAASVNKSVGATVHARTGSPDLRLAGWLVLGSVPFAFAGAFVVDAVGGADQQATFVKTAIGVALLLTALTYAVRQLIEARRRVRGSAIASGHRVRPVPTLVVGAVGGLLVGITSVGSGSIVMVALLLLYPGMEAVRRVGTDLVQAVPLVLAAAVSHVIVTGVDWGVLVPLLVGGAPGTYLGSRLAYRVPQHVVRRGIVIVLSLTGLALVGVPPVAVGIVAAALVILGPVGVALARERLLGPPGGPEGAGRVRPVEDGPDG